MTGLNIGLGTSYLVPGTFVQTLFAQGESLADAGERQVAYVMPMLASGGTWQANQLVQVKNDADALAGAGEGSPIHRALRRHFQTSKQGKVYALPYLPSSGVGVETADGYVAFAGTATNAGSASVTVAGETVIVGYPKDTTASQIGDLVEAKLNAKGFLPCSASNSSGEVTLAANIAGASQNGVIRFRAKILSGSGITITTSGETLGTGFGTAGVDGATTEQANFAAALAVLNSRKYFIVSNLSTTDGLTSLKSKLVADADPKVGKRQVGIVGTVAAHSSVATLSIAQNYERLMVVNQPYSELTPEELAASVAAVRSFYENQNSRAGFSGFRGNSEVNWVVPPVYDEANWIDTDDQNDMLTDGVTPIASDANGSYIVKAVTTRSKDNSGAVDDRRSLEPHRVSVVDDFADTLAARNNVTYAGQDYALKDDVRLADGTVDPLQEIPPKTVTPSLWRALPLRLIDAFSTAGKIKNVAAVRASLDVQISGTNPARLESGVDMQVVDLFDQTTIRIAETSQG